MGPSAKAFMRGRSNRQTLRRCKPMLGTYVDICISGEATHRELATISNAVYSEIARIEQLMSVHMNDSELTMINLNAYNKDIDLSEDLHTVIQYALTISARSNGIFDITIPTQVLIDQGHLPNRHASIDSSANWTDIILTNHSIRFKKHLHIDLGGIAKGYAVDRAMAICPSKFRMCINAGGDMKFNHKTTEKIGINVHNGQTKSIVPLPMNDYSMATTGCFYTPNRKSHIVSSHKKTTISHPFSVCVSAPDCMTADALTKIVWLCHPSNTASQLKNHHATARIVYPNGDVHSI